MRKPGGSGRQGETSKHKKVGAVEKALCHWKSQMAVTGEGKQNRIPFFTLEKPLDNHLSTEFKLILYFCPKGQKSSKCTI